MPDINERFSIDWLFGNKAKKSQQQDVGSSSLNEAFILYSQPIINKLHNVTTQPDRAGTIGFPANTLLSAAKTLCPCFLIVEI